jgi:ribulose-phosphate 3-epimerase
MPRLLNSDSVDLGASLMCADQAALRAEVEALDRAGVDSFHFDVMDGRFVPNVAMDPGAVRALRPATRRPFDVHLMVLEPERHVGRFIEDGADSLTFHIEAAADPAALARLIRSAGRRAGVAINPGTPVGALKGVIALVDLVCVMSVEPGFAGQRFIETVSPKIDALAALILEAASRARIQVDGNVSPARIPDLLDRGASMLVGGTSAIFRPGRSPSGEAARVRAGIDALLSFSKP